MDFSVSDNRIPENFHVVCEVVFTRLPVNLGHLYKMDAAYVKFMMCRCLMNRADWGLAIGCMNIVYSFFLFQFWAVELFRSLNSKCFVSKNVLIKLLKLPRLLYHQVGFVIRIQHDVQCDRHDKDCEKGKYLGLLLDVRNRCTFNIPSASHILQRRWVLASQIFVVPRLQHYNRWWVPIRLPC